MKLMFDCSYPRISNKIFKENDCFDFYRYANESIPTNMPESRGHEVSISMFVDADLAGDNSTRHSHTGVLIFINKAPIYWYINSQANVDASTFGEEFWAMKSGVKMFDAIRYKLQICEVPIDGSANVFCDNEAVYKNTVTPDSVLNNTNVLLPAIVSGRQCMILPSVLIRR